MIRTASYVLAGVLLFASLAYGHHQMNAATEARGEAEALRERNAVTEARLDSMAEAHARQDSARLDSIASLHESRRESELRAERAQARADSLGAVATDAGEDVDASLDSLWVSVPAPLVPVVETLRDQVTEERLAHEAHRQALLERIGEVEGQLAAADEEIRILEERIEARDEMIAALEASLQDMSDEADAWREAANPGFFAGFRQAVPQVLTGAAAVVAVALVL